MKYYICFFSSIYVLTCANYLRFCFSYWWSVHNCFNASFDVLLQTYIKNFIWHSKEDLRKISNWQLLQTCTKCIWFFSIGPSHLMLVLFPVDNRSSISVVTLSIWLQSTWTPHFEHALFGLWMLRIVEMGYQQGVQNFCWKIIKENRSKKPVAWWLVFVWKS